MHGNGWVGESILEFTFMWLLHDWAGVMIFFVSFFFMVHAVASLFPYGVCSHMP